MLKLLSILSISLSFAFSGALSYRFNTDSKALEEDTLVCTLGAFSTNNFYSQADDSPAKIYQESNGNQFLRLGLDAPSKRAYSSFYIVNSETFAEKGAYLLEFDFRYNAEFTTNNIFVSVFESGKTSRSETTTIASSKEFLDGSSELIPGSSWKHAKFPLVLTKAKSRDYNVLKLGFNTMLLENNYLDIDNIQLKKDEDVTFDETVNVNEYISTGVKSLGDFEDVKSDFVSPSDTFSVVAEASGNHYGKLVANSGVSSVKIYAKGFMSANKRTFEFKAKKGSAFSGIVSLYSNDSSTNPTFDFSSVSSDEWVVVSGKYNVNSAIDDYLLLKFETTNSEADNYFLIDDMYAIYGSEKNFINNAGDFESLEQKPLSGNNWFYSERLFMHAPATKVVYDGPTNKVLKVYEETTSTNFTLKLNPHIYETGWYELSFRLKGGSQFYCNNLGFRLYGTTASFDNKSVTGDNVLMKDSSYLSYIGKWDTIVAQFYLNADEPATYLGLNIWAFLHNDDINHKSNDNYCLIDDIRIFKQNSPTGEAAPNLIDSDISQIVGFDESQGLQQKGILDLEGYDYTKTIIDEKLFDKYKEGYRFTQCSAEQDYWGTVSQDIPATITKEDGYQSALLSYDGLNITKTFSSMTYLFNVVELQTTKRYLFEFDYKLQMSTVSNSTVARVAFIGNTNLDDYMIDLYNKGPGTYSTQGVNKYVYDYTIVDNGDGWNHVRLTFAPDFDFKTRVNSLRFLLDAKFDENNKMFVSNVKLIEHSNVEYNSIVPAIKVKEQNLVFVWIIAGCGGALLVAGGVLTVVLVSKKKKGRLNNEK